MTIIRITQEHSNTHTEFELLPDYKPMPAENFELARQWGGQGLLDNFTASFITLIENQRNYYAAIRNIMERKNELSRAPRVDCMRSTYHPRAHLRKPSRKGGNTGASR